MPSAPHRRRCTFCGAPINTPLKQGRPRIYCDVACRRKAQKLRDAQRGVPLQVPSARETVTRLARLAGRVAATQQERRPLALQLKLLESLAVQMERCRASLVHEAQIGGAEWTQIADWAGVTVDEAQSLWDDNSLRKLFPPSASRVDRTSEAVRRLARALSQLHAESETAIDEVAERTALDVAEVEQIFTGRASTTWPVIYMLTHELNGDSEDFRYLWECTQHRTPSPPAWPLQGHAGYFASALRGLRLAAGSPPLEDISLSATKPAACLKKILIGQHELSRSDAARLVRALDCPWEHLADLWQTVAQARTNLYGANAAQEPQCPDCRPGVNERDQRD